MPTISDLCPNIKPIEDLRNKMQRIADEIREKERAEIIRKHRESHIFDSYEDALDWLVKHPDDGLQWHAKTLYFLPDENLFLSYEQEYSLDGVIPYDVRRKYTREELLSNIYNFIKKRGTSLEKDFKDEYGKLEYVYK